MPENESSRKIGKNVIISVSVLVSFILLVILTHQVWCSHDFVTLSEEAATCTESGVEHWKCSKCGLKRDHEIKPLGHDLDDGETDTFLLGDIVFSQKIKKCTRCDYTEKGDTEREGEFNEYAVKMAVALWLVYHKVAALYPDSADVTLSKTQGYSLVGSYTNLCEYGTTHYVVALVEVSPSSMGKTEDDGVFEMTLDDRTLYVHPWSIVSDEWSFAEDKIF
nr:MAG TPA: zinc-ribbon containing domain protein [Caudoviricetes sp.]